MKLVIVFVCVLAVLAGALVALYYHLGLDEVVESLSDLETLDGDFYE